MTTDAHPTILLASASPRRRRLLEWLGVPFATTSVEVDEQLDSPLAADPPALAADLAARKALATRQRGAGAGSLVLCFDTIVILDYQILGKPRDADDAWRMLRALSGTTHQVVSGVAMLIPSARSPHTFAVTTNVSMKTLADTDIESWMRQGEFMTCAGAYNIEGQIAEVNDCECFQNVAGLPLCHLHRELLARAEWGSIGRPQSPVARCNAALERDCKLGPSVVGS